MAVAMTQMPHPISHSLKYRTVLRMWLLLAQMSNRPKEMAVASTNAPPFYLCLPESRYSRVKTNSVIKIKFHHLKRLVAMSSSELTVVMLSSSPWRRAMLKWLRLISS